MTADLMPIAVPGTDRQVMAKLVDGTPMVSLRHACDAIGVDYSGQLQKLKGRSWAGVEMISTPSAGGPQQTVVINRRTFTMWLATIDTNRVSDVARPIIEAFQAEAADAMNGDGRKPEVSVRRATCDTIVAPLRNARWAYASLTPSHAASSARVICHGIGSRCDPTRRLHHPVRRRSVRVLERRHGVGSD